MNNFEQRSLPAIDRTELSTFCRRIAATMLSAWVAIFIISIITCIFQIELLYIITYLLSAQTSLWLHDERKRMNASDRTESSALAATVHSFLLRGSCSIPRPWRPETAKRTLHFLLLFRLSSISGEMPENSNSWLSAPNFRWHKNQLRPSSFVIRIN